MEIECLILIFFTLTTAFAQDQQLQKTNYTGSYLVLAPTTVRANLPYSVSVNILKGTEPVYLTFAIIDAVSNQAVQQIQQYVFSGTPAIVKLAKMPNTLIDGLQYRLSVKGQTPNGKQLFEETHDLQYDSKSLSIFVQSDKKMYKPGSVVHFRVVCVYPDLKPYKGIGNVKITDPNQNIVQIFSNATFENGIFGTEGLTKLLLSLEPPLGDWTISVDVSGQKTKYSFTVDKYVLPKFEITMKIPTYLTINDDLSISVTAKYTYGKGVAGTVSIYIEAPNIWVQTKPMRKTVDLDENGEATVRITNEALKQNNLMTESASDNIQITVTVTETLTGIQVNESGSVTTYKQPYKISIRKSSGTLQPGSNQTFTIIMVTRDDKPIPAKADKKIEVLISYYFAPPSNADPDFRYDPVEMAQNITLDETGTKTLNVITLANATTMLIEARLGTPQTLRLPDGSVIEVTNEVYAAEYLRSSISPTKSFIQLTPKNLVPIKTGDIAEVHIKTNANIDTFTVQVVVRDNMVYIANVKPTNNEADIKIPTFSEMAPVSRLIVYGVKPDNKEIVVVSMNLKVSGLFKNNVSISVNHKRAQPNETVAFTVKASPRSYIGLLAVDQSILLAKRGFDITQEQVDQKIAGYDYPTEDVYSWRNRATNRKKRSVCKGFDWCGVDGSDAASVFENSNVIVFTDAYLYRTPILPTPMYPHGRLAPPSPPAPPPAPPPPPSLEETQKQAPTIKVRSHFPETWIWSSAITGANGEAIHSVRVPDTITSWVTTVLAMHDEHGFGVAPYAAKLEVFRPFFIQMNIPYSVKRGEQLALQVLIFNYMSEEQTVTVTLVGKETSGFDFVAKPGAATKTLNTRTLKVKGDNGSASVFFPIVPTVVGDVKILISAIGNNAADAIEVPLKVEAEGFLIYRTKSFIIDLIQNNSWSTSVKMDVPENVVAGSEKAFVSLVGDIMGPSLENIDKLIQMPYGCGEQNMLNFVPNIVAARYLKATSRLTPELESTTKRYMEAGYQRELSYQRDDFSYSAFGKSDKSGSTWLTAFVVRSFHQAKPYIFVDDEKLKESIKFLKSQQQENGAFAENGEVHNKAMQGGSAEGGPALTAFAFFAFFENDIINNEALKYLERSLDRYSNDSYALAIMSYALHLGQSSKKDDALTKLEKLAIVKDGFKYWSQHVGGIDSKEQAWWIHPPPVDVEMTAYALLTYVVRGDISGAVPLVRWLVSQQNSFGGYSSTQDTVVALKALGFYAEKVYTKNIDMTADVKNGDQQHSFIVNSNNAIVQQSYELKNFDKPVELSAKGKGVSFGHVGWHYNLVQLADTQPFICKRDVEQKSANDILVNLCCKYNRKGKSNMALIEVSSPSGFVIDRDHLYGLTKIRDLQRVETEKDETKANIYFNSLSEDQICFNISQQRAFSVSELKPATIKIIDYYNPAEQSQYEYTVTKKLNLQEACGGDCWKNVLPAASSDTQG